MTILTDERGSITGFVAVIATALVMVAGMAYDGGQDHPRPQRRPQRRRTSRPRRREQIDITHLRQTSEPRLDPAEAQAAALDYLTQVGATGTASVAGADITVTVTRSQPLHILPGQDRTITVTETASAVEEAAP